jgi:DNA-binding LacI/PurR family transcriptional regulator
VFSNPTIKDVARVAGVHFTTVSMALRGHPSIPATTRDRIVSAAGRIGYQRDEIFSALSNRRSRGANQSFVPRIAFISNISPEEEFQRHAAHRNLFEGAKQQAEALGYKFELLLVGTGGHTSASLYKYLKKHSITGIIIGGFESGRATLDLPWNEFSVIKVDSRHMEPPVAIVSTDQFNGVRVAIQRMRALGYRRLGVAVGLHDEEGTDDMHVSGLLAEMPDVGSKNWIPPLLFPRNAMAPDVVPLLGAWIKEHSIDAVICNWTSIRQLLADAGYKVPRDIACACLCLSRKNAALAGIVSNMGLVGQRASTLLATLLRSERRHAPTLATTTLVQGNWYDGSSAPLREQADH